MALTSTLTGCAGTRGSLATLLVIVAEKSCVAAREDHLEDLSILLEVEVEQPVRLVEAEHLKLLEAEALGVGEVVNDATGCRR